MLAVLPPLLATRGSIAAEFPGLAGAVVDEVRIRCCTSGSRPARASALPSSVRLIVYCCRSSSTLVPGDPAATLNRESVIEDISKRRRWSSRLCGAASTSSVIC
ncbi:hypothetical protein [Nocardia sp. NPDC047038]|uniref:hypothetical protein n=1 Tax=Nocardia sp. NPDC047038 TaxID=3154338 RepID=UPI0033E52B04